MLSILCLLALSTFGDGIEKSKKFTKSHAINPDATIEIDSRFGDVNISNWGKNEVFIEVTSSVEAPNEKKAERMLEQIYVDIDARQDYVSLGMDFKDLFENTNGRYKINIDVRIVVPKTVSVVADHKYGSLQVDEITGNFSAEIKYGDFRANKLTGESVSLELAYVDAASIREMNKPGIEIDYSSLNISKAKVLDIETKYSECKVENCPLINAEVKGGEMVIGTVEELFLEASMSEIQVNSLEKKAIVDHTYGEFEINNIAAEFERIEIENQYGSIKLNFNNKVSFGFNYEGTHCSFNYPSGFFQIDELVKERFSESVKGRAGADKDSKSQLKIESQFGDVEIRM